jgi:hypothetical protein
MVATMPAVRGRSVNEVQVRDGVPTWGGLLCLIIFAWPCESGATLIVNPSLGLEVDFTVSHPATPINGPLSPYPPDLIYFDVVDIVPKVPTLGLHSTFLFDGATQLGVVTNSSFSELGIFITASDAFFAGPNRQSVIDFSSILNGTIDGRLILTVTDGSFTFTDQSQVRGWLGLGGPGGTFGVGDRVNITSVRNVALASVPEPSSLALLGLGILCLGFLRLQPHNRLRGTSTQPG